MERGQARLRVRRVLRVLLWLLIVLVFVGALCVYFVYTPTPQVPRLSGQLTHGSIQIGGLQRTYITYVPQDLPKGAPLVVAMHGSGENGAQMRIETGYGFERLADERRFAVVYPDGYEGYWNACNIVGDYSANKLNIDDVAFLRSLAEKLTMQMTLDPRRIFAIGISRGGHMAFRLALEAPSSFRAVAAVAANMPAPDNFKCRPTGQGTSSVMIMNGTKDPLNPFNGGDVNFLGLLRRGKVLSSRGSGQFFADLNKISGAPETQQTQVGKGVSLQETLWRNFNATVEVELAVIVGGGDGMPQPYRRSPRILGPSPKEPNGPAMIWAFFDRQQDR